MMRLTRLLFIVISLLLSTQGRAVTYDTPVNYKWVFNVYLDDSLIGQHTFQLEKNGDSYRTRINAEFDIKFLFFDIFSYQHEAREHWQNQCLSSLSSRTENNGDQSHVSLRLVNGITHVSTGKKDYTVNNCVRSFAYWNPELLETNRLINPQTGEILNTHFTFTRKESIEVENQKVLASRYSLTGETIDIDLWYTADNKWVGLQTRVENGSTLKYRLEDYSRS